MINRMTGDNTMKLPSSYIGTVLTRPTAMSRMLAELRNRPGSALVAFHKLGGTARALAEIGRTFPALTERKTS